MVQARKYRSYRVIYDLHSASSARYAQVRACLAQLGQISQRFGSNIRVSTSISNLDEFSELVFKIFEDGDDVIVIDEIAGDARCSISSLTPEPDSEDAE